MELQYTEEDIARMEAEAASLARTISDAKAQLRNAQVAAAEEHYKSDLIGKIHVRVRDNYLLVMYIANVSITRTYDGTKQLKLCGPSFAVTPGGPSRLGHRDARAGMELSETYYETIDLDGDALPDTVCRDTIDIGNRHMYILPVDSMYGRNNIVSKWISNTVVKIKEGIDESVSHGLDTFKRRLREQK